MTEVFASGRFCNRSCAMSFSTRAKRLEINEKVRKTLAGRLPEHEKPRLEKKCPICGESFLSGSENLKYKKTQKFCSRYCSNQDPEVRGLLSQKRIEAIKNGKTNHKSIRCTYFFKDCTIRCDSKLEYACLDWFEQNYLVVNIRRARESILYEDRGQVRRYLPDFIIDTITDSYLVECKSEIYSESLSQKWGGYRRTAPLKKIALEKFAVDNNLIPFWFEPSTKGSRYRVLDSSILMGKI